MKILMFMVFCEKNIEKAIEVSVTVDKTETAMNCSSKGGIIQEGLRLFSLNMYLLSSNI
jgi:hypothetical protein